jgi:hypothetical protein
VVVKDGQAQELIDELKQILWHPNPAAAIVERGEASPLGHT